MTIRRREFLEIALARVVVGAARPALATGSFGNPIYETWTPRPSDLAPGRVFRHGVASGRPSTGRLGRPRRWTAGRPGQRPTFSRSGLSAQDLLQRTAVHGLGGLDPKKAHDRRSDVDVADPSDGPALPKIRPCCQEGRAHRL
jgi:hypothetical protein